MRGVRCTAPYHENQERTATAWRVCWHSQVGFTVQQTGLETARDSSSPWPQQKQLPPLSYPCCHGGIEMVVLGMVYVCSRLGTGGGVVDHSTAHR